MARVRLTLEQCGSGSLPDVCMFCGEPAVTRVRHRFSWRDPWVWLLLLAFVFVGIYVAILQTKRMFVLMPVCNRHRGYWKRRTRWFDGAVAGVFMIAVIALIAMLLFPIHLMKGELIALAAILSATMLGVWAVCWVDWCRVPIRAYEIRVDSINLDGVHPRFSESLETERRRAAASATPHDVRDDFHE